MLEQFRAAKEAEIRELREREKQGRPPAPLTGPRPSFAGALAVRPVPVIAEYKRASPAKGDINLDAEPEAVAAAYARAGAGAISVLTEETYFKGSLAYLGRMAGAGLPLLRKDFILHPLQVAQTAATAASAFLLIVRMLDDALLRDMIAAGRSFGLEAVVEIFNEDDLARARRADAAIIQVNNRDLDTLVTDRAVSRALIGRKRNGEFWITASGIADAEQLRSLLALGFDAALIGGSLMEAADPGAGLAALLRGDGHA